MNVNNLTDLFNLWQKEDKKQFEKNLFDKASMPKSINTDILIRLYKSILPKSFTADGYLRDNHGKIKVLFVAKEAHNTICTADNPTCTDMVNGEYHFWMKENIDNDSVYCVKRIKEILKFLVEENIVELDSKDIFKNVAYMNLNKRGGPSGKMSREDIHIFDTYVSTYKSYIRKEIEIINPEVIVCFGRSGKWTGSYVEDILKTDSNNKLYKIINVYHFSYRCSFEKIKSQIKIK